MFRVVNNKIYITRGDTPTYSASFYREDMAPYVIPRINNPRLVFTVRNTSYYDAGDAAIQYRFKWEIEDTFEDTKIYKYRDITDVGDPWIAPPTPEWSDAKKAAVYWANGTDENGKTVTEYMIYRYDEDEDEYEWVPYETPQLSFAFKHEDTRKLAVKTYWYDISLYGTNSDDTTEYKKAILVPHEFIVGGTLSRGK